MEKRNICIRLDLESYEILRQTAQKEYRTLSGQARFWIRQCIRNQEEHQPRPIKNEEPETSGSSVPKG